MSEIDDILAGYDYAETITRDFADGKLTVTLAEANGNRNPDFGLATWAAMQKNQTENPLTIPEDDKIRVFCMTLLKRWNVTDGGKPVDPKDAYDYLTKSRAARLLFREMHGLCWKPKLFLEEGTSKKKRSSSSTRKGTSSANRRKTSPRKQKPAAKKSLNESKSTSPA